MIHPDIKSYHDDRWDHYIAPLTDRAFFMGRNAYDLRWKKTKPAVNIKKEGEHFRMEISMPGFTKDDIKITLRGDVLTVRGERKKEEKSKEPDYVLREFDIDVAERRFKLAHLIAEDKILAEYRNGILRLTFIDLPVLEKRPQKHIEING